jgi:hypothetical protein
MSTPGWKELCRRAGLHAPDSFWAASEEEIAANFNGAGPDTFSLSRWRIVRAVFGDSDLNAAFRAILTRFLELFVLAFVIHDWRYANADRTEAGFHAANAEMLANMAILLEQAFPFRQFWRWADRARWWLRMRLAYRAVESDDGYQAWMD